MRIKVNKEEKKSPVINRHLETWKTTVNKRVIGINCCYHDDYDIYHTKYSAKS